MFKKPQTFQDDKGDFDPNSLLKAKNLPNARNLVTGDTSGTDSEQSVQLAMTIGVASLRMANGQAASYAPLSAMQQVAQQAQVALEKGHAADQSQGLELSPFGASFPDHQRPSGS